MSVAELSLVSYLVFALAIGFAGLVHGTLGLGFPLVATPLLALVVDVRSAILITLLPTITVNILSIVRGGELNESIGRYWPLACYAVVGSVIGSKLLAVLDPQPFKLLLAALVLVYLMVTQLRSLNWHWLTHHRHLGMAVFGITAGFAAGTTNVMVPVLIVYALEIGLVGTVMVQVFNLCFLAGKLSQTGVFALHGLLDAQLILIGLLLALWAALTLRIGVAIRDRIPTDVYKRVVRGLLWVLAFVLIIQFALGR